MKLSTLQSLMGLPKRCPRCYIGRLRLRFNSAERSLFWGCHLYPSCTFTKSLTISDLRKVFR